MVIMGASVGGDTSAAAFRVVSHSAAHLCQRSALYPQGIREGTRLAATPAVLTVIGAHVGAGRGDTVFHPAIGAAGRFNLKRRYG